MEKVSAFLEDVAKNKYYASLGVFMVVMALLQLYSRQCARLKKLTEEKAKTKGDTAAEFGYDINSVYAMMDKLAVDISCADVAGGFVYLDALCGHVPNRRKIRVFGHRRLLEVLAHLFDERPGLYVGGLMLGLVSVLFTFIFGKQGDAIVFSSIAGVLGCIVGYALFALARIFELHVERVHDLLAQPCCANAPANERNGLPPNHIGQAIDSNGPPRLPMGQGVAAAEGAINGGRAGIKHERGRGRRKR